MGEDSALLRTLARGIARWHWYVLGFWLVFGITTGVLAPRFIGVTEQNFDPPPGSLAKKAQDAMAVAFPAQASVSQLVVFIQCDDPKAKITDHPHVDKLTNLTHNIYHAVYAHDASFVMSVQSYIGMREARMSSFAYNRMLSPNHRSTMIVITVNAFYTSNDAGDFANWLLDKLPGLVPPDAHMYVALTGIPAFMKSMISSVERDMGMMDGIVLPIALCILGYILKSWRLMVVPVCSIGVSAAGAFGVMYLVGLVSSVFATTPSLMMSILIAMSIDYSLFLMTRFREALCEELGEAGLGALVDTDPRPTIDRVVEVMLGSAGFTITVSGLTLTCCFAGLLFFPVNMLFSLGLGCAVSLLITLLVNLTLTPALVTAFPHFFVKCVRPWKCKGGDGRVDVDELDMRNSTKSRTPLLGDEQTETGVWAFIAKWTQRKWLNIAIVIVVVGATLPFDLHAFGFTTTDGMVYALPRGADMTDAYNRMGADFGFGTIYPNTLLMKPPPGVPARSDAFFHMAWELLTQMATTIPGSTRENFNSVMYFDGFEVTYGTLKNCTDPHHVGYNTSTCISLRDAAATFINPAGDHLSAMITLNWDPIGKEGADWCKAARAQLRDFEAKSKAQFWLAGLPVNSMDVISTVYRDFPIMVGITAGVVLLLVGFAFRSIFIPLRAVLTIALTLVFVYGFAALTYEHGVLNWTSVAGLQSIHAVYWLAPITSFSIIVGIGLDYDIFLLVRIYEYRQQGYSTHDSIVKGLCRTGGIITAAGIIMAIAFSGLLASSMDILNQLAFYMVFSVLFDTFVVRSILVPALMSLIGELNWWPGNRWWVDNRRPVN